MCANEQIATNKQIANGKNDEIFLFFFFENQKQIVRCPSNSENVFKRERKKIKNKINQIIKKSSSHISCHAAVHIL